MAEREFLYAEETYRIRGAVFEVYGQMGSGFLEAVYQECLQLEFAKRAIPFQPQQPVQLVYAGSVLSQTYRADFVCFDRVLLELKAVRAIAPEHWAQLINYLKATGLPLGFLVNFGAAPRVEIERFALS